MTGPLESRGEASLLCDWTTEETWLASRREAIDHVLAAVAESEWSHCFALRGSVLMKVWFGDRAREPGDLDFVVLRERLPIGEVHLDELPLDVARRAAARSREPGSTVWIDIKIVDLELPGYWAYDAIGAGWTVLPGWGLLLSWQGNGHVGTIQVDFAVEAPIGEAPLRVEIPRLGRPGAPVSLHAFGQPTSLAWKVLWIAVDAQSAGSARAKHLYDAVLLAEQCALPRDLLERAVATVQGDPDDDEYDGDPDELTYPTLDSMIRAANDVDWNAFARSHPHLINAHDEYVWRFAIALASVVDDSDTLYPRLLEHCVHELAAARAARAAGGMPAVERALAESHCSAVVNLSSSGSYSVAPIAHYWTRPRTLLP
ncbi:nucleotidyl transferase AbiEii/AbiGii toxin family protein [Nocardia sp. Marseille-Q1738]